MGVLIPCRDEEQLILRKLENLFRMQWPVAGAPHRLVLVDDNSTDRTVERMQEFLSTRNTPHLHVEQIANNVRPGKNGALEAGIAALGDEVDLIIMSDADVLVDAGAPGIMQATFAQDARLGMACASQLFVPDLAQDGSCPGADGSERNSMADGWDRGTAAIRRLESRFGKLFSVHGQWLAWRADLGLRPGQGVAADDVDLMLQVRGSARPRVELLEALKFYEIKPAAGKALDSQALRRARAWFQAFGPEQDRTPLRGVDRLQAGIYATLPRHAPELVLVAMLTFPVLSYFVAGPLAGLLAFAIVALVGLAPRERGWRRTLRLIAEARRLEGQLAMAEDWEMQRE
jgi:GT2 family glycosyltransferase